MKIPTTVERESERELVVSRTINGPPRLMFEAWTRSEFRRWWVPKLAPVSLLSCEMGARAGGTYRLVLSFGSQTMKFIFNYVEVTDGLGGCTLPPSPVRGPVPHLPAPPSIATGIGLAHPQYRFTQSVRPSCPRTAMPHQ
jgi:hypothetical protein